MSTQNWITKYPFTARDEGMFKRCLESLQKKIDFEIKNRDFAISNIEAYQKEWHELEARRIEFLQESAKQK